MASRIASRIAARFATRRLYSSGGKMLGEEEKAAENVYIKKVEQEKLEKLARKGVKPGEQPPAAPATEVKPSEAPGSSTKGVSTDQNRNYAVLAGTVTVLAGFGWYFLSKPKKAEETAD